MIPWLDQFVTDAAQRLQTLPPLHDARLYLPSRGVSPPRQIEYRIGWLDSPTVQRCTPEFWTWLQKYGWWSFVFPLTDAFGAVTGVVLRSLSTKRYENFLAYPKELSPPCFGLHTALPVAFQSQRLLVTEGIFDFFALREFAVDVVACLTAIPSRGLRRVMARYTARVVCLTDMDKPGRRGAYSLAGLPVPPEYADPKDKVKTRITPPPFQVLIPAYSAHDPSDLLQGGRSAELRRLASL